MPIGLTSAPAAPEAPPALTLSGDVNTDALDWLPPLAAERLRNLRQRSADLHGAIPSFEQRQEANLAKTESAQRLARLTGRRTELSGTGFGFELSPDDPRCVAEQKKLDSLAKAAERINGLYEQRSAEWNAASRALAGVETWLKGGRPGDTVLADREGEVPKPRNGESLLDAIARLRKKIADLQAEISDIERRPLPSGWCRQKAKAQIEALAARGRPDVSGLATQGLDVAWPTERHSHPINGFTPKGLPIGGLCAFETVDILALLCHANKPAMLAAVDAAIAAEKTDDAKALDPNAKERTLADLRVKLLHVERDDCAATFLAIFEQRLGQIEFRGDADPRAVLNVDLLVAKPASSAGTSFGAHVFDLVGIGRG